MTKALKILSIKGCIAPQLFGLKDDEFVFFEKVNAEEGRFFKRDKEGIKTIYNTFDSQGIVENGELYTIKIGTNTVIERITGDKLKIEIEGVYFDFKVGDDGNIVCIGYDGKQSILKIFSKTGDEITSIKIKNLLFANSIRIHEDEIFLSGFTKENKLKLIKINYIGAVIEEFSVDTNAEERLISKIHVSKDKIYLTINGKKDSLYIMDINGDKIKEIYSNDIGMKCITDSYIKDDKLYILSEKNMHIFSINKMLHFKSSIFRFSFLKENIKIPYVYFMITDILRDNFAVGIMLSTLIYTYIYMFNSFTLSIVESIFFIWILSSLLSITIGFIKLRSKSSRIMYLLNIQQKSIDNCIERVLFLYTIIMSIISLLFAYDLRIISVIVNTIALVATLLIDKYLRLYMERKREDIVIELLSGDKSLQDNFKRLIKYSEKGEKLLLNIKVENDFSKKYLSKWNKSRSFILGKDLNYIFTDKTFVSVVDLSKRDIKYSKISILLDLVSYIGEKGIVKEINAMWVD